MQTIGERLEEARKRKGISIREASESTKIRSDYLQKFESNTFEIGLPDIYVRGFLRGYAHFLKLSSEKLLTDYAGLGIGDSRENRRHQELPPREIIGRIDLPETSRPAPAPATQHSQEPSAQRAQPMPRSTPTAVVTGAPSADRRKQLKLPLIVGGAVVALLILVLVIRAIFSDSSSPSRTTATPSRPASTPAQAEEPATGDVIRLIAIDNVQVKVIQLSNGQELFSGDLVKGETRYIRKDGKIQVLYNPGRNLRVEVRGQQYKMTIDGSGQNTLQ